MKVWIVYPRANIDTVPSLVGAAEALAEAGHEVEVFTYLQAGQPAPRFSSARVRVRLLGVEGLAEYSTAPLRGALKRANWIPRAARRPLVRTYEVLNTGLSGGTRLMARARGAVLERKREDAPGCVIGVDPDGLVLAHDLARGAPVAYYSLELLLSADLTSPGEVQLKSRERELCQRSAFVIVQDEERGKLLADDNGVPRERLMLVPNAPAGPARRAPSRYWHARFNLSATARVALHAGSLGDWTGIEAIVDSVRAWPDPWVLVVHTRYEADSSTYVAALRQRADPSRVLFSLKPVPHQDYDTLIDGGDVGLAFYLPNSNSAYTQRNVQTIGLSSGKLAHYLRAGLPVIVNRSASIAGPIARAGAGLAVDDAADIGAGLSTVASNYQSFSAAAVAFFQQQLDFRRAFASVVQRLEALG